MMFAKMMAGFLLLASMGAFGQDAGAQPARKPLNTAWSKPLSPEHDAAVEKAEVAAVLHPFWRGHLMKREPVLFVARDASSPATAQLLFAPEKVLRVESGDGATVYEAGQDYAWKRGDRTLTLLPGSRIPMKTAAELFPPKGSPGSFSENKDGTRGLLFHEGGRAFQQMQVFVTYEHRDRWRGFIPKPEGKLLPATMAKLRSGMPLKLVVLGDSISHGACASDVFHGFPYQPPYVGLVAEALYAEYRDVIQLVNLSVGGTTSAWGVNQASRVAAEKPDLVILAFGMNDAPEGTSVEAYRDQMRAIMETIRTTNPNVEFLLVATMTANPDWRAADQNLFLGYRDALEKMEGPGVAVADMTTMWNELVARKRFDALTGNGVNHPNDFGHRVYAQVILATLK